jgi:putative transposase
MKKKRFSVEQIVSVLKQAELGVSVAEVIRKVGISEQTFYRWKKQYVGLETDQARQMKQKTMLMLMVGAEVIGFAR